MKKLMTASLIMLLTAAWSIAKTQDTPAEYLGLPGDNLNLYAVMKLFQESETLEGFERSLNDQNTMINNLDLNGDRYVDYIMVHDYADGDVHTIVLRTALNKNEYQDVAVFTVERFRDGSVYIQLIGDEALYGPNYIVEPIYAEANETPNPGYIGNTRNNVNVQVVRTTTYEVAAWPVVRYIYHPTYVVYRSPWIWGRRYAYWNPWRPVYWHYYYGYHYHYHPHYYAHFHVHNKYRYARYNDFYYTKVRVYSPRVSTKIKEGRYKSTYSRPDTRKNGEAHYVRVNARQVERNQGNTPNGRNDEVTTRPRNSTGGQAVEPTRRTPATNGNQPTRSTNVEAPRRSAGTNGNQPARSTKVEAPRRSAGTSGNQPARSTKVEAPRRTPAAEAKQPARSTSADKKVEAPRRSNANAAPQPAKSPSVEKKAETRSRQAAKVSERSAPKAKSAPRESAKQAAPSKQKASVSKEKPASRARATEKKASDNKSSSSSARRR